MVVEALQDQHGTPEDGIKEDEVHASAGLGAAAGDEDSQCNIVAGYELKNVSFKLFFYYI